MTSLEELLSYQQDHLDQITSQIDQTQHDLETDQIEISQITHQLEQISSQMMAHQSTKPLISSEQLEERLQLQKTHEQQINDWQTTNQLLTQLQQEQTQRRQFQEQLTLIANELETIASQKFPFNPKCSACQQQPWKLRQIQLHQEHDRLTALLQTLSESDPTKIESLSIQYKELTRWMDHYQKLEELIPNPEQSWHDYQKDQQQLTQLTQERTQFHQRQVQLNQTHKVLSERLKNLEREKRISQQEVDGLHFVINYRPKLTQLEHDLTKIAQWRQDRDLYQLFQRYQSQAVDFDYYQQQKLLLDQQSTWQQDYETIQTKISWQMEHLKELQTIQNLLEINQVKTHEEQEARQQIHLWELYDQDQTQLRTYQASLITHQIDQTNQDLQTLDTYQKTQQ